MPVSWPKPLRWVVPKWISRATLVSWAAAALVPTQGFPTHAGSPLPKKLPPTLPSYPAQLHLRVPLPLLQNPGLGAASPSPPTILTSQVVPSGSQISVRLRLVPGFCTILGLSFPHL